MKKTNEIYLEIFSLEDESCVAPIETVVNLFILKYCESDTIVSFVINEKKCETRGYTVNISATKYRVVAFSDLPYYARSCDLPNVIVNDDTVVAGLCASLRQIVKATLFSNPTHYCSTLLGFKDSCLLSPSESSVWTKYCEIDLISTLKSLDDKILGDRVLPESLARFEIHMSQPVRLHNVYKYTMSKKFAINGVTTQEHGIMPEHLYAEGSFITLADIIIFVCFRVFINFVPIERLEKLLPLTCSWYERLRENQYIDECSRFIETDEIQVFRTTYALPAVNNQSLYKSDPKRYKPRNRIYTKQDDVENSLQLIDQLPVSLELSSEPFGAEMEIDWKDIPQDATPVGGKLPITRLKRKFEQLENLCKPVLKLAKSGDVIIDFCSGSGHLGILVAYLRPDCTVVLLENKEESLNRSKERVERLKLSNVKFYQCNLDYFKGDFDIGISLHACGVATDLVIQHCIRRNAVFVSCPCCYGSVHDCHHITYPRSEIFRGSIKIRDYLVLGHAADQTHDEKNAKTRQGNECMAVIDTDRRLQAQEFGYKVHLAKLVPQSCTPKNHLLVGIPTNRPNPAPITNRTSI